MRVTNLLHSSTIRFKAAPPVNPAVDLPFSVALGVLILPLTVPAVLYEAAFESKAH